MNKLQIKNLKKNANKNQTLQKVQTSETNERKLNELPCLKIYKESSLFRSFNNRKKHLKIKLINLSLKQIYRNKSLFYFYRTSLTQLNIKIKVATGGIIDMKSPLRLSIEAASRKGLLESRLAKQLQVNMLQYIQ